MANKREFKKGVDAIGTSVCDEMMAAYYNIEGVDRKAVSDALEKVLVAIGNAKDNANVFFDKGPKAFEDRKAYAKAKAAFFKSLFVKINKDFANELDAALKQFNAAIPASIKAENKAAVAE